MVQKVVTRLIFNELDTRLQAVVLVVVGVFSDFLAKTTSKMTKMGGENENGNFFQPYFLLLQLLQLKLNFNRSQYSTAFSFVTTCRIPP